MAATSTAETLRSRSLRRMVDFDPDATTATIVDLVPGSNDELIPIEEYRKFLFGLFRSVGTGSVTSFEVIAATDADGTGATAVVSHAIGSAPNAVGDTIWLECNVEQVHEVLSTATHVGARIALVTATDECVVFVEATEALYPRTGLTADYIS